MGDPKYPRRLWKKPKRPFNYELKMEELKTLGTFGLKTKRELWKARTQLSRVRNQARSLLALRQEIREEKEPILMNSLKRVGLVGEDSTLDDVLNLQVTDLLSRRLQTMVMKNFGFKTPYQARQAVVHGHIMIGDRIVDIPSYVVTVNEEKIVKLVPNSSLHKLLEKAQSESEATPEETVGEASVEESVVKEPSQTDETPSEEVNAKETPSEEVNAKETPSEEVNAKESSTEKPEE